MYQIDTTKQVEILRWLMYAWDGQWQGRTAAIYGPGEASKINTRVRSAFGKIEMKALLALLGKKQAADLSDATDMLKTYFELAYGARGFSGQFRPVEAGPSGNARLVVEVTKLTPFDALKKAAQAAGENPSLACEMLWNSWIETLLPEGSIQVTYRSGATGDLYQIDNLNEKFTAVATPDDIFEPNFDIFNTSASPAPMPTSMPLAPQAPATSSLPIPAPVPAVQPEYISPIASALQIPLEQIAPKALAPADFDPYASGPASYTVPAPKPAPITPPPPTNNSGLVGTGETPVARPGGRINLSSMTSSESLPLPPFGAISGPVNPPVSQPNPAVFGQPGLPNPPFMAPVPPPLTNPSMLNVDPATGRRLFSNDTDEEARQKVGREKGKNPMLLSRLFVSKQGREILAQSADTPAPEIVSMATSINTLLQRRLQVLHQTLPGVYPNPFHVLDGLGGDLQIVVGPQIYRSVGDIPPGPARDLLQQVIEQWNAGQ